MVRGVRGGGVGLRRPPREVAAIAVGILLTGALAGCQRGTKLGVYNACGFSIDADLNEVRSPSSHSWTRVEDGERGSGWLTTETATEFFVWARTAEGAPEHEFTIAREGLPAPPEGSTFDLEIVVEGDRCPS